MTTDPTQAAAALTTKINDLDRRITALQSDARLADVQDEVENLDTAIGKLKARLSEIRALGYVFGRDLDDKIAATVRQWPALRSGAKAQIAKQAPDLQSGLKPLEVKLANVKRRQAQVAEATRLVGDALPGVENLEARVTAAQAAIRGTFDAFKRDADQLAARLTEIERMVEWTRDAKFTLLAGEGVYAAVAAKWDRDGKDDPKGRLFLTDQRVLFERREEIATKKFLFVATEKELVHELLLEVPVREVEGSVANDRGLFGNEDHIDVAFSHEAPVRAAHFHLDGQDNKLWVTLIERAKTGEFDKERAVKVEPGVDHSATAPTKCPSCGANFTRPVMRGQTEIKCEFCGSIARLG
ncbi:MAG: hypothetical protein JNL73_02310 [Anaerolineales bacterium]|nr:hypothetical protein [Anaerolineales bacterium]